MSTSRSNNTTASRLGRLEADVEHLSQDVGKLASTVEIGLKGLSSKLDEKTKPADQKWVFGVVTSLIAMVLVLSQCQQEKAVDDAGKQGETRAKLSGLREDMNELVSWARETQRSRFSDTDARRLDDALQREMRDLDNVSKVRLDNLDTILQREMDLKIAPINARIAAAERHLAGRDGNRWNRDMQTAWQRDVYHRDLAELRREIDRIRSRVDKHQSDGHPHKVEERLGGVAALLRSVDERLKVVEAEQRSRTSKVYKDG